MQKLTNYFLHRRSLNGLKHLLKETGRVRDLRGDIASDRDLRDLAQAERKARQELFARNYPEMEPAASGLAQSIRKLYPRKPYAAFRENFEVLIVAAVVALAVRTYFIQPFKIPTSSMSPSLNGIYYLPQEKPGLWDRVPLKFGRWLIYGDWYLEIKARSSGIVNFGQNRGDGKFIEINGIQHRIYDNMMIRVSEGDTVFAGQLLASGRRVAGDHIFVNKLSWNFRQPQRGEIIVFKTNDIIHRQIRKNEYYVKRLVALPDETVAIRQPYLIINGRQLGQQIPAPIGIARIQDCLPGYYGYKNMGDLLANESDSVGLGPDDFFACGDNQSSSLDSRYWGPVRRKNLVGPAFFIYWPLSSHWGLAE